MNSNPGRATWSPADIGPDESERTTLGLRISIATFQAIERQAKAEGTTMKRVVCRALAASGLDIQASDLEDLTPTRRGGWANKNGA